MTNINRARGTARVIPVEKLNLSVSTPTALPASRESGFDQFGPAGDRTLPSRLRDLP